MKNGIVFFKIYDQRDNLKVAACMTGKCYNYTLKTPTTMASLGRDALLKLKQSALSSPGRALNDAI